MNKEIKFREGIAPKSDQIVGLMNVQGCITNNLETVSDWSDGNEEVELIRRQVVEFMFKLIPGTGFDQFEGAPTLFCYDAKKDEYYVTSECLVYKRKIENATS